MGRPGGACRDGTSYFQGMRVQEVMTSDVVTVAPEATLRQAAEAMRLRDTGFLPVCASDRLVGTVTDRDLVVRGLAVGADPDASSVSEVMSSHVLTCSADTTLEEAARRMEQAQVRRLVVLDRGHQLVGVVTLGDLSQALDACKGGEALEAISEPDHHVQ